MLLKDKLLILYEQEILRCYNRAAREAINQSVPLSYCSIIKDEEIYSQPSCVGEPLIPAIIAEEPACSNSEEKFFKNLTNLRTKFQKLKVKLKKK